MASPNTYPITGLCIIADATKCPPGYEMILRSHDKQEECDLWKDGFFRSRITRYLCFTRTFPLESGRLNNVLVDVALVNDREPPPVGFSLLDLTLDTREKATQKKQIAVKMVTRDQAQDAINELIFMSRNKRPPSGYTLVGELNGLLICFKIGRVPQDTQNTTNQVPASSIPPPTLPYQFPVTPAQSSNMNAQYPVNPVAAPTLSNGPSNLSRAPHHPPLAARESTAMLTPVCGVPFELNSRLDGTESMSLMIPDLHFRSLVDIENEYNYNFLNEKSATMVRTPSFGE